ncbi:1-deoxy-D-xylulose-5-phosphate synthase [Coprothermobacter platensis]|uniref:1-deoxy-D-xylulose-5-phosphate synthase n=1 Tax=Coprothermobacter platensis TaxID=108819 RepID=UPI00036267FC|nr:1-deoxy-D-xylulose-5-phosphate synthase [Coprothermobacter platensis]
MQIPDYHKLREYSLPDLKVLAGEIRKHILESTHLQGGHVASNLGVVEITLGLAHVFDLDKDVVIFDTSHQSYTFKMLTGRSDDLPSIRTLGGLSGFSDPVESEFDRHYCGHAGTGLSLAYGEAMAKKLKNDSGRVIVVVGDGALTNGVSYEGLNNIGASGLPIVIVLNDNEHSISKNVGAMAAYLAKLRSSNAYRSVKTFITNTLRKAGAHGLEETLEKAKLALKEAFQLDTFFEKLGIVYLGPFDGNDMASVLVGLRIAQSFDKPTVVHLLTKKGSGYEPAEKSPVAFHSAGPFEIMSGEISLDQSRNFTNAFGEKMVESADSYPIVAITAAMTDGTGLSKFSEKYPERFLDVGIAEEHAVITASALAANGFIPVVAVYSTFLQRSYDQLIHDVALAKRHVIFALDRAGLVPADGPTHQGLWDIAYALHVPNSRIYAPYDEMTLRLSLDQALEGDGPCFVRYPKGSMPELSLSSSGEYIHTGYGTDFTLIAYGPLVAEALKALDILKATGLKGQLFGVYQVKPIPQVLIKNVQGSSRIYVLEEGIRDYGAAALWRSLGYKVVSIGVNDPFVPAGSRSELLHLTMLDGEGIAKRICRHEYSQSTLAFNSKLTDLFLENKPTVSANKKKRDQF